MAVNYQPQSTKGAIAILFIVLILSVFLIIAVAMSVIIFKQVKMSGQVGYSLGAYQAADTGVEYALFQINYHLEIGEERICPNWFTFGSGPGRYCLKLIQDAEGKITNLKSNGWFGSVRRAIEVDLREVAESSS